MLSGIIGLLIFALDVWAILSIMQSQESMGTKVLWTILVLLLPVLGLLVWYFAGPKSATG